MRRWNAEGNKFYVVMEIFSFQVKISIKTVQQSSKVEYWIPNLTFKRTKNQRERNRNVIY